MKKIILSALTVLMLIIACKTVPVTGRKQLHLLPESTLVSMSLDQYRQFLSENQVVNNTAQSQMVKRVGENIAQATETYLRQNNEADMIENLKWEFNLVQDDQANAWAMPGGKVVIYSGILKYTQDEAGLATVMSHEIAHAIAQHGNERMSQMLTAQLGGMALDVALRNKPNETRNMFLTAYGLGAQVGVLLPFSRTQESEADKIGLVFMAMAGYDPRESLNFWKRMEAGSSGGQPPEFLSTHPSHQTRLNNLRKFMPTALKYYKPK